MSFRMLVTLTTVVLIAGCAGEETTDRKGSDQGVENSISDGSALICSTTGVSTPDCDPFENTGCAEGSCYVTKGVGPSCVCPAGDKALGEECNTSTECAPGSVCAGTEAPGICRKSCLENTDCQGGFSCLVITGLEPYGYCIPDEG